MRVLVTGAAGFIGSHLYHLLLQHGHDVITLDDYSTGDRLRLHVRDPELKNRRWLLEGSVTDQRDVERALALAPDVVFHLAAQIDVRASVTDPIGDAGTNVMGTLRMLQASVAAGVRRFVFVSSAAVFGDQRQPTSLRGGARSFQTAPISPYGASKAAATLYVELYDRMGVIGHHNMVASTVTLSNVYGPRQRPGTGAVNIFARQLLAGTPVTLYGDGQNVRDYVYVADAAAIIAAAGGTLLDSRGHLVPALVSRGRTLVGTGVGTTDQQLLGLVVAEVVHQGGQAPRSGAHMGPARAADIRSMVFPRHDMAVTPLAEGIKRTVEAVRKELETRD